MEVPDGYVSTIENSLQNERTLVLKYKAKLACLACDCVVTLRVSSLELGDHPSFAIDDHKPGCQFIEIMQEIEGAVGVPF